jgi:hypothetical protein
MVMLSLIRFTKKLEGVTANVKCFKNTTTATDLITVGCSLINTKSI